MKPSNEVDQIIHAAGGVPPVDGSQRILVGGGPVTDDHRELKPNGQQKDYVVLSEAERARGFVRPVRCSYVHVGPPGPKFETRDVTPEERQRFGADWAVFEPYPAGYRGSAKGRFWTQEDLDKVGKGCVTVTRMGTSIAETYARSPGFYGATFCCGCGTHLPVGDRGEFVWDGTTERVGT